MAFIAEETVRALREYGTEELPHYEAALHDACTAFPPPFGQAWYGEKYRTMASDPTWLAASLIANAEKEGEGSRKLWVLVGRTGDPDTAEAIRQHAIDESRHALLYVAMCELVFPGSLEGQVKTYADLLSPRYSLRDLPPEQSKAHPEVVLDELIQMNIGEIRTRIHQLLLRPVLTAFCDKNSRSRLFQVLDSLLRDETKHVQYTARLIEQAARNGRAEFVMFTTAARIDDFNTITLAEVGEAKFVGQ
jgi:hypothetical protein